MYQVFQRALSRRDISTGRVELARNATYATEGPTDIMDVKNEVPDPKLSICYLYGAPITCTPEQLEALRDGSAVVEDFVVVSPPVTREA